MSAIPPTINCKLDEEQMDVLLGDIRDLLDRIDALERRIVKLESRTAASEGRLDGMSDGVLLRFEAIEGRIEALEKRCGKIAAFSYGDNDSRIKDHERRIEKIERKLNHKGERTMDERTGGDE